MYLHPHTAAVSATEQKFRMQMLKESTGKASPRLAASRQVRWQYKCTVKHYNQIRYSAIILFMSIVYKEHTVEHSVVKIL
jgi:hypothetical protein